MQISNSCPLNGGNHFAVQLRGVQLKLYLYRNSELSKLFKFIETVKKKLTIVVKIMNSSESIILVASP
jgi:hypothetical protein